MKRSFAILALACVAVGACSAGSTQTTSGGGGDGGASSGSTSSTTGGGTSSTSSSSGGPTKTALEAYCDAHCVKNETCSTDPKAKCYAALAATDKLSELQACVAQNKCSPTACGIASSASTDYVATCKAKAGSCGGSMGGISAGDCDDIVPLFRDDVTTAMKSCFSSACADVSPCLLAKVKSAEPTACAGF